MIPRPEDIRARPRALEAGPADYDPDRDPLAWTGMLGQLVTIDVGPFRAVARLLAVRAAGGQVLLQVCQDWTDSRPKWIESSRCHGAEEVQS